MRKYRFGAPGRCAIATRLARIARLDADPVSANSFVIGPISAFFPPWHGRGLGIKTARVAATERFQFYGKSNRH